MRPRRVAEMAFSFGHVQRQAVAHSADKPIEGLNCFWFTNLHRMIPGRTYKAKESKSLWEHVNQTMAAGLKPIASVNQAEAAAFGMKRRIAPKARPLAPGSIPLAPFASGLFARTLFEIWPWVKTSYPQ